ncbi:MAG: hypothetical protein LQ343_003215 [Gyalolechia ehrenbergii]|nr:MAG: hypothetical protein LQ343_003215 [Gyalolechia ehrenbergii]
MKTGDLQSCGRFKNLLNFYGTGNLVLATRQAFNWHHARVYIAGRSPKRLQDAAASMKTAAPPGQELDLHLLEIDLGAPQSVKDAAEGFQQQES